jgi:hypothetical protein
LVRNSLVEVCSLSSSKASPQVHSSELLGGVCVGGEGGRGAKACGTRGETPLKYRRGESHTAVLRKEEDW